jgi:hypothetical protein
MADFPDSTLLPKLHQALSRRALMREMAAAGMLAAGPVAATAASAPVPSPRVRMNALIEELFAVAREFDPRIERWTVRITEPEQGYDGKCSILIAAFLAPEPTGRKAEIDWGQV